MSTVRIKVAILNIRARPGRFPRNCTNSHLTLVCRGDNEGINANKAWKLPFAGNTQGKLGINHLATIY